MPAYCRAKLANILFTRQLSKRLADDNIVTHAMHPGLVNSNFFNHGDDGMKHYLDDKKDKSKSPAEAADTLIWLASADAPGQMSSDYFYERAVIPTSAFAQDAAAAERLWHESEKLVSQSLGMK